MKKIKLTQGKYALVDDADYAELSKYNWSLARRKHTCYAQRGMTVGRNVRSIVLMHRQILGVDRSIEVDHKNRDGLDNRRQNLRKASRSQNARNSSGWREHTSRYKGVSAYVMRRGNRTYKYWKAQIWLDNTNVFLGVRKSEEAAAHLYEVAAKKYYGRFARWSDV